VLPPDGVGSGLRPASGRLPVASRARPSTRALGSEGLLGSRRPGRDLNAILEACLILFRLVGVAWQDLREGLVAGQPAVLPEWSFAAVSRRYSVCRHRQPGRGGRRDGPAQGDQLLMHKDPDSPCRLGGWGLAW